jgi:hypothetical protein
MHGFPAEAVQCSRSHAHVLPKCTITNTIRYLKLPPSVKTLDLVAGRAVGRSAV